MKKYQFAIFITVVIFILATWHFYLWERLVLESNLSHWTFVSLSTVMFIAPVSIIIYFLFDTPKYFSIVPNWWMGFSFLLLSMTLFSDLLRLTPLPYDSRTSAITVVTTAFLFTIRGFWNAFHPKTKRVEITLPRLPKAFDGLKIAQLTDIHIGPMLNGEFLDKLVAQVMREKPDLIAITGDAVDGSIEETGVMASGYGNLKAPHGVYYVTGNHEYYHGADEWVDFFKSKDIKPLRNTHHKIEKDGATLIVAGVNDFRAKDSSVKKAIEGTENGHFKLLLAHQPKSFIEACEHEIDLQLSGHTHGGQIFPFGFFSWLDQKFLAGLYSEKNSRLYVSRGNGFWGPPIRIGAPSEITFITLKS